MSQDWRKRLEEQVEAERQKEQKAMAAAAAAEYARKLAKLSRKFECHVCGVRPTEPLVISPDPYGGWGSGGGTYWNEPGDLHRCYCCNKWTCEGHCHLIDVGGRRVYVCRDHDGGQIKEYSAEGDELRKMGVVLIISIIALLVPSLVWNLPLLGWVFALIVWYMGGKMIEPTTRLVEFLWEFILFTLVVVAFSYGVVTWLSSQHSPYHY